MYIFVYTLWNVCFSSSYSPPPPPSSRQDPASTLSADGRSDAPHLHTRVSVGQLRSALLQQTGNGVQPEGLKPELYAPLCVCLTYIHSVYPGSFKLFDLTSPPSTAHQVPQRWQGHVFAGFGGEAGRGRRSPPCQALPAGRAGWRPQEWRTLQDAANHCRGGGGEQRVGDVLLVTMMKSSLGRRDLKFSQSKLKRKVSFCYLPLFFTFCIPLSCLGC